MDEKAPPDLRNQARTHLFVMATIVSDEISGPVHIRNISSSGAFVEADLLPAPGARVSLHRGEQSVSGTVVRKHKKGVGLQFDHRVVTSDWLPAARAAQEMVDFEVAAAKQGKPAPHRDLRSSYRAAPSELLTLAGELDELADALSENPEIIAKFNTKLQVLDLVAQKLRQLALAKQPLS